MTDTAQEAHFGPHSYTAALARRRLRADLPGHAALSVVKSACKLAHEARRTSPAMLLDTRSHDPPYVRRENLRITDDVTTLTRTD